MSLVLTSLARRACCVVCRATLNQVLYFVGLKSTTPTVACALTNTLPALTFAATRTCAQDENLRIAVAPSLSAPADIAVRTLYSGASADTWAWGFRASSPVAQVTFANPGVQEDAACGPLLDAVAIKELPTPYPTKGERDLPGTHLLFFFKSLELEWRCR